MRSRIEPTKRHFRGLHGWLLKLNSHRRFSSYSFLLHTITMAVEKDSEASYIQLVLILTAVICYFQTCGKKGLWKIIAGTDSIILTGENEIM
jgi:hypothetical protein